MEIKQNYYTTGYDPKGDPKNWCDECKNLTAGFCWRHGGSYTVTVNLDLRTILWCSSCKKAMLIDWNYCPYCGGALNTRQIYDY